MGRDMILTLPTDRVKLLKAGFTGKQIEKVFVTLNNYHVVEGNVLYENNY